MKVRFNLTTLMRRALPLAVLLLTACLDGGGRTVAGSSGGWNATADTTAQSLTIGTAMASFSPLTPSGGKTPYTYSITTGTLPAGLSLNTSTGAVTGTPTATYTTANIVFSVQDAYGTVADTTSTVSFTVVAAPFTATADTTAQSLTVGTAMTSFTPLTPSGGAIPYTYNITSGTLPVGLSLNASTGAVTGTPASIYTTANVVFSVKDVYNVVASTTSTVSFTVGAASVSISATATTTAQSLTFGTVMTSFSPLTPSGGATPYTYSVTTGTLPTGLSLNASTGAVTGTPTAIYTAANVIFSVKDANNVVASTTSTVSFTVGLPTGYVSQGGLIWMPVSATTYTQPQAVTLCAGSILGLTGWRLPTQTELSALTASYLMYGQGWTLGITWTSTLVSAGIHNVVDMSGGVVYSYNDTTSNYVTCVH